MPSKNPRKNNNRGSNLNFKKLAMKLCHFLLNNYDKLCKIEEKCAKIMLLKRLGV